ncbi:MAG: hypothetical protein AAFR15_08855, partial [Cyanobacteria bacterium J06627_15]
MGTAPPFPRYTHPFDRTAILSQSSYLPEPDSYLYEHLAATAPPYGAHTVGLLLAQATSEPVEELPVDEASEPADEPTDELAESDTESGSIESDSIESDSVDGIESGDAVAQETGTAADLMIKPFYRAGFNDVGPNEAFAGFEAFYPLAQVPGSNVTFLTGRINLNVDGDFGGGLQAGYRALLNEGVIWGAYGGFDLRETGDNTFGQLGLGGELLGNNWDANLSASFPVGDSSDTIDTSFTAANARFSENVLLVDTELVDRNESALTVLSIDGGYQLLGDDSSSELWGRGGLYLLTGEASDDTVGVRASLDYRPQNDLRFGFGLQHDEIFGTNVVFSLNALFGPGSSSRRPESEADPQARLWARASEPLNRVNTVLVEERDDVEVRIGEVVIDPDTGEAYNFLHVDPGSGIAAGLGTFEDPRDTVANIVGISGSGDIIYVQAGDAGGSFTIPDGVEVLSVGPTQIVPSIFGDFAVDITLPGSGSGNF